MVQLSGAAIPGVLLCFSAMVLLLFVSVSEPTWDRVSFLNVRMDNGTTHYGCFGYTNHDVGIGYYFSNDRLNSRILHNLTKTLILHPIACGLAGIAFAFGLIGAICHRSGTILMTLIGGLAFLTTFVAWVIDMILFGIARQRYRNDGLWAQYGNANWLTLGALVALILAFCTSAVGSFGRYRKKRAADTTSTGYAPSATHHTTHATPSAAYHVPPSTSTYTAPAAGYAPPTGVTPATYGETTI